MLFKQFKQSFRLSEVHNGMDRLKPSPAGQMNRRSRSRDRDNWRGKMRRETGRCRGFPCFSMSICLIWCQKLVRNLGACSRYKVDAFLLFFSNATLQYWWAAPGQSDAWTRWILEASGKPTKINKNMAFEKETLALPRIIQPPLIGSESIGR